MARIRIPALYRTGLKHISTISDDEFYNLVELLNSAPISILTPRDIDQLIPQTITMPRDKAAEIVDAVFSMSITIDFNDVSSQQFTQDVVDTLEREPVEDIPLTDKTRKALMERLPALLDINMVKIGAKATNVFREHQHAFGRARILTDLRPVFGDDVADAPAGVTLVHTLKLEYQESEQDKEFFIALDTRELQQLLDVVERAKAKEKGLKALLSAADISLIDFAEGIS